MFGRGAADEKDEAGFLVDADIVKSAGDLDAC
jgi:hypothetical protein